MATVAAQHAVIEVIIKGCYEGHQQRLLKRSQKVVMVVITKDSYDYHQRLLRRSSPKVIKTVTDIKTSSKIVKEIITYR